MYPFPDPLPPLRLLSDAEKAANRDALLQANPTADGSVWVFGFGSLIWNPGFAYTEKRKAILHGHTRTFSFWTMRSRGTSEAPGLGLAIEAGDGVCEAIAFRLAEREIEDDLKRLWDREMAAGVYVPVWRQVDTVAGEIPALCFIANAEHTSYAGALPRERVVSVMARAAGSHGACRDYLASLVAALPEHDLEDPDMIELLALVDAERAQMT